MSMLVVLMAIISVEGFQLQEPRCSEPPEVLHAKCLKCKATDIYTLSTIVNFRCDEGYYFSGDLNTSIICQSNRKWTTPPLCVANSCEPPTNMIGVEYLDYKPAHEYRFKSTISYKCSDGFMHKYNHLQPIIHCQQDGTWTDTNLCYPDGLEAGAEFNGEDICGVLTVPYPAYLKQPCTDAEFWCDCYNMFLQPAFFNQVHCPEGFYNSEEPLIYCRRNSQTKKHQWGDSSSCIAESEDDYMNLALHQKAEINPPKLSDDKWHPDYYRHPALAINGKLKCSPTPGFIYFNPWAESGGGANNWFRIIYSTLVYIDRVKIVPVGIHDDMINDTSSWESNSNLLVYMSNESSTISPDENTKLCYYIHSPFCLEYYRKCMNNDQIGTYLIIYRNVTHEMGMSFCEVETYGYVLSSCNAPDTQYGADISADGSASYVSSYQMGHVLSYTCIKNHIIIDMDSGFVSTRGTTKCQTDGSWEYNRCVPDMRVLTRPNPPPLVRGYYEDAVTCAGIRKYLLEPGVFERIRLICMKSGQVRRAVRLATLQALQYEAVDGEPFVDLFYNTSSEQLEWTQPGVCVNMRHEVEQPYVGYSEWNKVHRLPVRITPKDSNWFYSEEKVTVNEGYYCMIYNYAETFGNFLQLFGESLYFGRSYPNPTLEIDFGANRLQIVTRVAIIAVNPYADDPISSAHLTVFMSNETDLDEPNEHSAFCYYIKDKFCYMYSRLCKNKTTPARYLILSRDKNIEATFQICRVIAIGKEAWCRRSYRGYEHPAIDSQSNFMLSPPVYADQTSSVTCGTGYGPDTVHNITCSHIGEWGAHPQCHVSLQNRLEDECSLLIINNGRCGRTLYDSKNQPADNTIPISLDPTILKVYPCQCDEGFKLEGPDYIECRGYQLSGNVRGNFTTAPPSCVAESGRYPNIAVNKLSRVYPQYRHEWNNQWINDGVTYRNSNRSNPFISQSIGPNYEYSDGGTVWGGAQHGLSIYLHYIFNLTHVKLYNFYNDNYNTVNVLRRGNQAFKGYMATTNISVIDSLTFPESLSPTANQDLCFFNLYGFGDIYSRSCETEQIGNTFLIYRDQWNIVRYRHWIDIIALTEVELFGYALICSAPDFYKQNIICTKQTTYLYDVTVTCECLPEYFVSENELTTTCQAAGEWTALPTCYKSECSNTPTDSYGNITCTEVEYRFSDKILKRCILSCESGYMPYGDPQFDCIFNNQTNGSQFTAIPQCTEITDSYRTDYTELFRTGSLTYVHPSYYLYNSDTGNMPMRFEMDDILYMEGDISSADLTGYSNHWIKIDLDTLVSVVSVALQSRNVEASRDFDVVLTQNHDPNLLDDGSQLCYHVNYLVSADVLYNRLCSIIIAGRYLLMIRNVPVYQPLAFNHISVTGRAVHCALLSHIGLQATSLTEFRTTPTVGQASIDCIPGYKSSTTGDLSTTNLTCDLYGVWRGLGSYHCVAVVAMNGPPLTRDLLEDTSCKLYTNTVLLMCVSGPARGDLHVHYRRNERGEFAWSPLPLCESPDGNLINLALDSKIMGLDINLHDMMSLTMTDGNMCQFEGSHQMVFKKFMYVDLGYMAAIDRVVLYGLALNRVDLYDDSAVYNEDYLIYVSDNTPQINSLPRMISDVSTDKICYYVKNKFGEIYNRFCDQRVTGRILIVQRMELDAMIGFCEIEAWGYVKNCPDPASTYGSITPATQNTQYRSVVECTCKQGFKSTIRNGNQFIITCMSDGKWNYQHQCILDVTNEPPFVPRGNYKYSIIHTIEGTQYNLTCSDLHRDGTTRLVECAPDSSLRGDSVVKAESFNGSHWMWSNPPVCEDLTTYPYLTNIALHKQVKLRPSPADYQLSGDSATDGVYCLTLGMESVSTSYPDIYDVYYWMIILHEEFSSHIVRVVLYNPVNFDMDTYKRESLESQRDLFVYTTNSLEYISYNKLTDTDKLCYYLQYPFCYKYDRLCDKEVVGRSLIVERNSNSIIKSGLSFCEIEVFGYVEYCNHAYGLGGPLKADQADTYSCNILSDLLYQATGFNITTNASEAGSSQIRCFADGIARDPGDRLPFEAFCKENSRLSPENFPSVPLPPDSSVSECIPLHPSNLNSNDGYLYIHRVNIVCNSGLVLNNSPHLDLVVNGEDLEWQETTRCVQPDANWINYSPFGMTDQFPSSPSQPSWKSQDGNTDCSSVDSFSSTLDGIASPHIWWIKFPKSIPVNRVKIVNPADYSEGQQYLSIYTIKTWNYDKVTSALLLDSIREMRDVSLCYTINDVFCENPYDRLCNTPTEAVMVAIVRAEDIYPALSLCEVEIYGPGPDPVDGSTELVNVLMRDYPAMINMDEAQANIELPPVENGNVSYCIEESSSLPHTIYCIYESNDGWSLIGSNLIRLDRDDYGVHTWSEPPSFAEVHDEEYLNLIESADTVNGINRNYPIVLVSPDNGRDKSSLFDGDTTCKPPSGITRIDPNTEHYIQIQIAYLNVVTRAVLYNTNNGAIVQRLDLYLYASNGQIHTSSNLQSSDICSYIMYQFLLRYDTLCQTLQTGRYFNIHRVRNSLKPLELCEVELFGQRKCPVYSGDRIIASCDVVSGTLYNVGYNSSCTCGDFEGHRICQYNGAWSDCTYEIKPIICDAVPTVPNSHSNITQSVKYKPNDVIMYTCDVGLNHAYDSSVRCDENGQWQGRVKCITVRCETFSSNDLNLICSKPLNTDYSTSYWCSCLTGYTLADRDQYKTTCRQDGSWSSNPTCVINEVQYSATSPKAQPYVPSLIQSFTAEAFSEPAYILD